MTSFHPKKYQMTRLSFVQENVWQRHNSCLCTVSVQVMTLTVAKEIRGTDWNATTTNQRQKINVHHIWTSSIGSILSNNMYPWQKNPPGPMFSTGLISWIFVCFDIAETILRTRIDGFREKGRTSSHIHLFPISTNSSSHVQNTNTNTENDGQFLISKTKKVCLSPQAVSGNFSSVLALKFWSFVYKLWPYDSFWGEAIECPAYKYVRQ